MCVRLTRTHLKLFTTTIYAKIYTTFGSLPPTDNCTFAIANQYMASPVAFPHAESNNKCQSPVRKSPPSFYVCAEECGEYRTFSIHHFPFRESHRLNSILVHPAGLVQMSYPCSWTTTLLIVHRKPTKPLFF